jgi:1-deoxy-D-xylulose-5-phosphate reductoisomerase
MTVRVLLLGSTGSIGRQTIDVIGHLRALHRRGEIDNDYEIVGLASGTRAAELETQARELGVTELALADQNAAFELPGHKVRRGPSAAEELVREVEADIVLAAIVGSAGIPATLAAAQLGRDVALANKETLVAAGDLIIPAARDSGARLLPVDSEHAGVWQCLRSATREMITPPCRAPDDIRRVVLTASGGPFRGRKPKEIHNATPEQALDHPTWDMGPKVTIDCATLMNKALEVIEAHWLFGLEPERIGVLVHPQSIVHALIEMRGGATIAQLATTDMRIPIQHALTDPSPAARPDTLDLAQIGRLDFEPADAARYPALGTAHEVIRREGTMGATLNAANEAAVEAFLGGRIAFGRIVELVLSAMESLPHAPLRTLEDVLGADEEARRFVRQRIG